MQRILVHCTAPSEDHVPVYQSMYAAGADLRASMETALTIQPMERCAIPTGLSFQIPEGYEAQVRPRSGLALKSGITILNTPATIDSDYRGEVRVIVVNLGSQPFTVQPGDRIAQIVFAPVVRAHFVQTESLTLTERGENGFGSTGV